MAVTGIEEEGRQFSGGGRRRLRLKCVWIEAKVDSVGQLWGGVT